jgi:hypothetical protein
LERALYANEASGHEQEVLVFNRHLHDRSVGISLRVILQLLLEFGNPTLGFLFINFSGVKFPGDFVKKSFKESFHPFPPSYDKMPGKQRRV